MYSSVRINNGMPWAQYLLTVCVALVPLPLWATLRNSAMIGQSGSMILMVAAGVIFSILGVYSSIKDTHKGFGMASLAAGAVLVGLAQLSIL